MLFVLGARLSQELEQEPEPPARPRSLEPLEAPPRPTRRRWGSSHRELRDRAVWFAANGTLHTDEWGDGTWGVVPGPWRKDSLHAKLHNETYLLMFLSEKWSFVALRCSDEQVTYGRLGRQADPIPEQRLVW